MDEEPRDRRHFVVVTAVAAVVLAGSALFVATFVLSTGSTLPSTVQAGASVEPTPSNATEDPGSVTVAWTSNTRNPEGDGLLYDEDPDHADYLTVRWAATSTEAVDALDPGHAERNVTVTEGTWRLGAVGHSVTLTERDATSATTVRVLVTAVRDGEKTVIVAKEVTL